MATNFPSSADSFTNPTSGDTLDNPPHDQQHANINDAMEAVQASLLDGAPLHIDDANERVGVGTSSPQDVLHVVGDVTIEVDNDGSAAQPEVTLHRESATPADGDYLGQVKFAGKNDAGQTVNYAKITGKISDVTDTTEDGLIEIANIKAGSQSIGYRITSTDLKLINGRGLQVDGNVGIGTTSPSFPLSVDIDAPATYGNAAGNFAQMWTNSGTNALGVSMGDDLDVGLITNNGYAFNLGTDGNTRMTINSSGNVGINDTTPSYKLDVNGDINSQTDVMVGGSSLPRGYVADQRRTVSVTISTTPVNLLSQSVNVVAGRKYFMAWSGWTYATSTTMVITAMIRVNGSGVQRSSVSASSSMDNANIATFGIWEATSTGSVTVDVQVYTSTGTSTVRFTSGQFDSNWSIIDVGE